MGEAIEQGGKALTEKGPWKVGVRSASWGVNAKRGQKGEQKAKRFLKRRVVHGGSPTTRSKKRSGNSGNEERGGKV